MWFFDLTGGADRAGAVRLATNCTLMLILLKLIDV